MSSQSKAPIHQKKRTVRKKTPATVWLLYFVALATALFVVTPLLIQKIDLKRLIGQIASEKLGVDFTVDNIDIRIMDGPSITMSNVLVSSETGDTLASVKQVKAELSLTSVMKGKFSLSNVFLEKPAVHLVRHKDGNFNIPLLNKKGAVKTGAAPTAKTSLMKVLGLFEIATIKDGLFYWEDMAVGTTPVQTAFRDVQVDILRAGLLESAVIKIKGDLQTGGGHSTPLDIFVKADTSFDHDQNLVNISLSGNTSFEQLDVKGFWPYIKPHVPFHKSPEGIVSWNGNISGDMVSGFLSSGEITVEGIRLKYAKAFSKDVVPPTALKIRYNTGFKGDTLTINEAKATLGVFEFTGNGKLGELNTKNPKIMITLGTNELDLDEVRRYLPDKTLTPQQTTFLNENIVAGKIALVDFTFNGDLEKLRNMGASESLTSLSGKLLVNDMGISLPTLSYPFLDIAGVFELSQNELTLSGLTGRYGSSRLADISGYLTDIYGWPSFGVYIKADIDLDEVKHVLAKKVTVPGLKSQIEKIEEMEGTAKVDLTIAGDTLDIAGTISMDGDVLVKDVKISHAFFDLPMANLNGKMEMSQDDFYTEDLSWEMGSSTFSISGSLLSAFRETPSFDLKLNATLSLDTINDLWLTKFGDIYDQKGTAKMGVTIKGDISDFTVLQELDMTEAEYRFKDIILKQNGFKNVFTCELSVKEQTKLRVSHLFIDIGESRLEVKGEIEPLLKGEGVDLTFYSDGMLFDDIDRFLKPLEDIDSGGYISGAFSLKKRSPEDDVVLLGTLRVENADFKLSLFSGAFRESTGVFELVNNKLFLRNATGRFGDGKFTGSANVIFALQKPKININIEAETLNLKDFLKKRTLSDERKDREKEKPGYLARGEWNIRGTAQKGKIGSISYENLDLTMRFANKTFNMAPLNFSAYGGSVMLEGGIKILGYGMIGFDYNFRAQDVEMKGYIKEVLHKKRIISGKLNLNGRVRGKGANLDMMKRSVNGSLSISSGKGIIRKFTVLSKILSLLNVSQYLRLEFPDLAVDGMPFNSIGADFKIAHGIAKTENFILDSEAMRISAVGEFNVGKTAIDMKVGVMPFRAIDRLVTIIPVVGEVLTGKEEALLALYFTARGPVGKPDVKAIPLQSIAEGIGGLLKRILELPVNAARAMGEGLQKSGGSGNVDDKQKESLEGQVD